MSIVQEFKAFAMRGNVVDLAVGVIIGGAFGKIVSSFVADIIMPPIGLLIGGTNFERLFIVLKSSGEIRNGVILPPTTLNYGIFLQNVVDFLIIAFVVFLMVKLLNKMQKAKEAPAAPGPTKTEMLLTEIRDSLKK